MEKPDVTHIHPRAWIIWTIGTCFVVYQFMLQLSSGVMVQALMSSFSMTAIGAGVLAGSYYYIYVALQTPAGMLMDRFGARRLLSIGALVAAAGCFVFSASQQLLWAQLGRVLMGGGSAFAFVGALYLISHWFPAARFALMLGIADVFAMLGTLGGNIAIARQIEQHGWRGMMQLAGVVALVLSLLCWLIVRDSPKGDLIRSESSWEKFKRGVGLVIKDRRVWINGFYCGAMFSVATVFTGMWGIPYIVLRDGVDNGTATLVANMLFLGMAVACPFVGWLYPKMRRYLPEVLFAVTAITTVLISIVIYMSLPNLIVYGVLMFFIGIMDCVYVFNFAFAKEIAPDIAESTCIGFTNTLTVLTVPVFQLLTGYLLHWSNSLQGPVESAVYNLKDYRVALAVLPISLVVVSVLVLLNRREFRVD